MLQVAFGGDKCATRFRHLLTINGQEAMGKYACGLSEISPMQHSRPKKRVKINDVFTDMVTKGPQADLLANLQAQVKAYEKIEYIKPGSNLVKIQKNGKTVSVDLNKLNLR